MIMGGLGDALGLSGRCLGVFGSAEDAQGTFRSDRGEQQNTSKCHENYHFGIMNSQISHAGACLARRGAPPFHLNDS